MKVARIYLRVSTDEQDLTRQVGIEHNTRDAGYYIAGVYREKASGARADRPELLSNWRGPVESTPVAFPIPQPICVLSRCVVLVRPSNELRSWQVVAKARSSAFGQCI